MNKLQNILANTVFGTSLLLTQPSYSEIFSENKPKQEMYNKAAEALFERTIPEKNLEDVIRIDVYEVNKQKSEEKGSEELSYNDLMERIEIEMYEKGGPKKPIKIRDETVRYMTEGKINILGICFGTDEGLERYYKIVKKRGEYIEENYHKGYQFYSKNFDPNSVNTKIENRIPLDALYSTIDLTNTRIYLFHKPNIKIKDMVQGVFLLNGIDNDLVPIEESEKHQNILKHGRKIMEKSGEKMGISDSKEIIAATEKELSEREQEVMSKLAKQINEEFSATKIPLHPNEKISDHEILRNIYIELEDNDINPGDYTVYTEFAFQLRDYNNTTLIKGKTPGILFEY